MSGNVKFRFLLVPIVIALLVIASPVRAKDFLIADIYFDDGSVLSNAEISGKELNGASRLVSKRIRVKHENEIIWLNYEDIKTLEFDVKRINKTYPSNIAWGEDAIITIKIKTKTGAVIKDSLTNTISKSPVYLNKGMVLLME
jgi:hypothetical protein